MAGRQSRLARTMAEGAPSDARYTAFLSYSHKDAEAATTIHRRLESYRIPRRLVGTNSARGPVPHRLAPIFRDREELPAASDLSETVRTALAQSGALVILCSPHAAGSLWVAEEVKSFRKLHPDRPILAAILDGEAPDCFPDTLRALDADGTRREPLATDLRPGMDGTPLGILKLVAGISGLGLDDLVQRDAARRVRRVTVAIAAALIAMVIMAALAFTALQARREADRQRAEAARQIESMIIDLRERLHRVGQLDILDVDQHALDYYSRQSLGSLDSKSLEGRARVLHLIGTDDLAKGRLDLAWIAFNNAYRTTAEHLKRDPNNLDRIYAHAQSEYYIGEMYRQSHSWPQALKYFKLCAAAAERLILSSPENPNYLTEAGYAASRIGSVQLEGLSDPIAAETSFKTALYLFQRAGQVQSDNKTAVRSQATTYANLADTYNAQDLLRQALIVHRREHAAFLSIHSAHPEDMDVLYQLAIAERAVARQLTVLNETDSALPYRAAAYRHAVALTEYNETNTDWLVLRANIACDLLFGSPAERRIASPDALRDDMSSALRKLMTLREPKAREIWRCLAASQKRLDTH